MAVRTLFSATLVLMLVAFVSLDGQTPQPFPRPGQPQDAPTPPAAVPRETERPSPPAASQAPVAPGPETLVFPPYPAAEFLASYDAGRGQRYYLFGTTAPFSNIVNYYRTTLDERGRTVFDEPATHMFEVGRFRDDTMAFPPGVTVKDWTWGGSGGYPNPVLHAQPARFPTVIMIVPPPAGSAEP